MLQIENIGYAETYADYRPAKLRSGLAHPDCVIESASLSSVTPPDIQYNLSIPEEVRLFVLKFSSIAFKPSFWVVILFFVLSRLF